MKTWFLALSLAGTVLVMTFVQAVRSEPQVGQCFALDLETPSRWVGSRTWEPTDAELAATGVAESDLYIGYDMRAAGPWTMLIGRRIQNGELQECVLAVLQEMEAGR